MRIEYDPEVDALYIRFRSVAPGMAENRELSEDVIADYGPNGQLVGIEILEASQVLGETPGHVIVDVVTAKAGAGSR